MDITSCSHTPSHKISEFGIGADFVAAATFAWLAREPLANRPEVTGASGLRVLGSIIS